MQEKESKKRRIFFLFLMFPSLKGIIIYLMKQELMLIKTLKLIQDSVQLTDKGTI